MTTRWLAIVAVVALLPGVAVAQPAAPAEQVIGCSDLDPARCLLPFPSDAFTTADASSPTGRRLALPAAGMPRNAAGTPISAAPYNDSDGFSPGAMIVTKVPGLDTAQAIGHTAPVDLTDLSRYADADAPVVVLDVDHPAGPTRHPIWVELDANPVNPADAALLIRPAVNFTEGHRHIVVLRNLRDADGQPIPAQDAFAGLRSGTEVSARAEHYAEAIWPVLDRAGISRDGSLHLAWDFTVASAEGLAGRLLHIRDDGFGQLGDDDLGDLIVEGDSPQVIVDRITEQLPCRAELSVPPITCEEEDLDPRVLRRVEARVMVPCYLSTPDCATGGRFIIGTDGLPVAIPGNQVAANVICNIPAGAAEGQTFRPTLYGHGLLGDASRVNRGELYSLHDDGLMFCSTDWIGMAFEDIPNVVATFGDFNMFPSIPDRLQQAILNQMFLGRALLHDDGFGADPAFQVDGRSVLDTSALHYYGESQGGIVGGALTAVAPDFTRALLAVPGMNYSTMLRRAEDFDQFALVMYAAYPDELERPLLLSLVQTLWDRGESNGYAHHMTDDPFPNTPAHRVLMNTAFGDHQVTNWATDVMARTVGAQIRQPALDAGRHPAGGQAFWGLEPITSFPFAGSAMIVGDGGATPPPIANVPNREGPDHHGRTSEDAWSLPQIAAFLQPEGEVITVCGDLPCYLGNHNGGTPAG